LLIALHCRVATHREIPIEIEIKSEKIPAMRKFEIL